MATLHMKGRPTNKPFYECLELAKEQIARGATIYQKWTCEKCGERVRANEPNTFTEFGHHN